MRRATQHNPAFGLPYGEGIGGARVQPGLLGLNSISVAEEEAYRRANFMNLKRTAGMPPAGVPVSSVEPGDYRGTRVRGL